MPATIGALVPALVTGGKHFAKARVFRRFVPVPEGKTSLPTRRPTTSPPSRIDINPPFSVSSSDKRFMRILALDHGTVRIGVALSDELKMIASPLEFIPAEPFADVLTRLKTLVREKEVELVVIGMPRNMDGSYGPAAEKVREFATALKDALAIPLKMWDERLTSTQANRMMAESGVKRDQRKGKVDGMAAAIFLQSYLDATGGGAME